MASVEHLASKLADVHRVLDSHVANGLDKATVGNSLFNSWQTRLQALDGLTGRDAKALQDAVAAGPWSGTQKKELVSTLLAASTAVPTEKPKRQRHMMATGEGESLSKRKERTLCG